jgi:methyl-accepting chemotaxis protein
MSLAPSSLARYTDRLFAAGLAAGTLSGAAAAWWHGAGAYVIWGWVVAGAVGVGVGLRMAGHRAVAWVLAGGTMAAVLALCQATPQHPALMLLPVMLLGLVPLYRSAQLVVVLGLVAAAAPWVPGFGWAEDHRGIYSAVMLVQTAFTAAVARFNLRQSKQLFDIDFLMKAMQIGDSIRLDLGVVKPETKFGDRFMDIQTRMAGTLQKVAGSAKAATEAAVALQASSGALSDRTQTACVELSGAASTLQQIAVIVKTSAESATNARLTALEASTTAKAGAAIVHEMVGQMATIDAKSRRIGEITTLIESIAFQTNLLALNAAVEAARAGDQGRSFAVVAAEVRLLAQRVAGAAGEVAELVDASNQAIARGNELASSAGSTIDHLTASVARVDEVFHDLSADTVEHAAGIHAMSDALLDLNASTQQNLEVVRQARQIANDLGDHANGLAEAMSVFRLGGQSAVTWGRVERQAVDAGSRPVYAAAAAATSGAVPNGTVVFF